MKSDRLDWLVWLLTALKFALFVFAAYAALGIVQDALHPKPGPEWVHERGSIYWSCTDSGRALVRDVDTGSTFLDRNDNKCDAGG